MEQERDYQVVYFKDLFITVVRQWKKIVAAMLICALLLVVVQYCAVTFFPSERSAARLDEEMSQRELAKQGLEDTEMRIETQRAYLSTSPLMALDPNNYYEANLTLYIHTDYKIDPSVSVQTPDSMPSILYAYRQILTEVSVVTRLAEASGLPSQYMHEMVNSQAIEAHPGIVKITILSTNQKTGQILLDLLIEILQERQETVESITQEEHTLLLEHHAPALSADNSLAETQTAAYQHLTSLQNQKISWQKRLQQVSLNLASTEANPLLIAGLGSVVGIFLAVAFICIRHLATGTIYSARTLKHSTGLKVLGCVRSFKKISRFQCWLNALEGRCVKKDQIAVMITLLRNYSAKYEKIMITSSCPNTDSKELKHALNVAKVPCVICNCLIDDPVALQELPSCDAVVLLEQCYVSHVSKIDYTIQLIADEKKELLGCILIDG